MKIRIKFSKSGALCYIGHLDMMRYFQKAIRRADIPVRYSQGFHPHQIMSFAAPLGIGMSSEAEYMDIEVDSFSSSAEMIERLNRVCSEDVVITDCRVLADGAGNAMASMFAADYRITFPEGMPNCLVGSISDFLAQSQIPVIKKKTGVPQDIRPLIYLLEADERALYMRVAASSKNNVRPESLVNALYEFCGLKEDPFAYRICRTEIYSEGFIPLSELGSISL